MEEAKIQSVVRMFLARRHIRNTVNYIKNIKNTLIEQTIKNKGGNPKSILATSRYYKQHLFLNIKLKKCNILIYVRKNRVYYLNMCYNQLCRWFLSYRKKHVDDKIGYFKRLFDKWFIHHLPENIILNYIDLRATLMFV